MHPPIYPRRDAYLPGVQALARSLRLVRTRYPLIVMYTRTCRYVWAHRLWPNAACELVWVY